MASPPGADAARPPYRRILLWAGLLLLGFLLLSTLAALWSNGSAVLAALAHITPGQVCALLALSSIAFLLRAVRWQLYSRAQGMHVPFVDNSAIYLGGFALGATPGRVGEVVRLVLLRRGYGLPFRRTAPLLVADRLNDVNTLALLMLVGVSYVLQERLLIIVALALVVALNLAFRHPAPLLAMVNAMHRATGRRHARAAASLRRLLRRIAGTFAPRTQVIASLLSLAAWSAECTSLYWILDTLAGSTGGGIDIRAAFAIHATASLIGALSMLPGGLGGFEATCLALLVWQGVPAPEAVVATAVLRVTTFWYSLMLGLPALALAGALVGRAAMLREPAEDGSTGQPGR